MVYERMSRMMKIFPIFIIIRTGKLLAELTTTTGRSLARSFRVRIVFAEELAS